MNVICHICNWGVGEFAIEEDRGEWYEVVTNCVCFGCANQYYAKQWPGVRRPFRFRHLTSMETNPFNG